MANAEIIGAVAVGDLGYALRSLSEDIGDLILSDLEEAAKAVAADAARRVPRVTGRTANSYRAVGTKVEFGVGLDHVPWLEFGGARPRDQKKIRPYVHGGRYGYPAINENMKDVEARVDEMIAAATNGYLEVE